MDKNCSSSCHFFFCFVLKSNNNKWAFAESHTKKTHFTMITHKSWGLHYSPAQMICAIRGSLCVVQIVIKKPSKEICDLKRVFYPSRWLMSPSSVICYQLTCLFSNQERKGRQRFQSETWWGLWTIGGSVLPQTATAAAAAAVYLQVVWIQSWQRKAWGCSADLIRQKQILTCSFLSCLPSISLQSVGEKRFMVQL